MTPLELYIDGIAFAGPGLNDWDILSETLRQDTPWTPDEDWSPVPECMSARAARRVSPQIRLALKIAEQLGAVLDEDAGWVFASSVGEGETLGLILEALRTPEMMIQPLRFQNAVHNAASGQWSIAAGITGPMTSVAALDDTVGAGVLKSGMQVVQEARHVGLVIYDTPLPEPLDAKRPLGHPLGVGIAFSPHATSNTIARLEISLCEEAETPATRVASKSLQATDNPVAAVMPLLERLVEKQSDPVILGLHGNCALRLNVSAT